MRSLPMRRFAFALACLSYARCGRRTESASLQSGSGNLVLEEDALDSLKAMMLALQPVNSANLFRVESRPAVDFIPNRRGLQGRSSQIMSADTAQVETDMWLANAARVSPPIAPLLEPLREAALQELEGLHLPSRREEPWRQFDLSKLKAARIRAPTSTNYDEVTKLLAEHSDDTSDGMRLVLVDGVYNAALSDLSDLSSDVYVGSVLNATGIVSESLLQTLKRALPETNADSRLALGSHTFAALNHASLSDVIGVWVPPGVKVERPLHIVVLSTTLGEDDSEADVSFSASHPNLIVSVGDDASLEMLQQYAGRGSYFVNGLSRFDVGKGATLKHYYVQEQSATAFHVDSLNVEVDGNAVFDNQMLQSGGQNSRVNLQVNLNKDYASASLRGLTIANERQVIDAHTAVLHAAGNCTSKQEHRNAVGDRARAVFKGTIMVPEGSDNTVANQLARTLLLTDDARADVSPCLLIKTDGVECTHGATISDMDDEMVLYLQARGLSPIEARALLLKGWTDSALDDVPARLTRKHVEEKALALSIPQNPRHLRSKELSSI